MTKTSVPIQWEETPFWKDSKMTDAMLRNIWEKVEFANIKR